MELTLDTEEAHEDLSAALGASPYIVGSPVSEDMLYGRGETLAQITHQFGEARANVVLLEGNRRTGKTSILGQLGLRREALLPGWITIYCNFQDAEGHEFKKGVPTKNVFRFLTREIILGLKEAGVSTWLPGEPTPSPDREFDFALSDSLSSFFNNEHPFETFKRFLSRALEAAHPSKVLLLVDEFDKLQEGIDEGVTSPQVPENLRHMVQHNEGLSAILTGSRRLKRLREEYWSSLFGLGHRVAVSKLPRADALMLVTEPASRQLKYLSAARDQIVEYCAQHPFLIQMLCNHLYMSAANTGERVITVDAVANGVHSMIEDNEHFRTLWDYASTARRQFLLVSCARLTDASDPMSLEYLLRYLEQNGIPVTSDQSVDEDLTYLRELELLRWDREYRGGTYRIAVPIFSEWLKRHIDFGGVVARSQFEAEERSR